MSQAIYTLNKFVMTAEKLKLFLRIAELNNNQSIVT